MSCFAALIGIVLLAALIGKMMICARFDGLPARACMLA
jgi:hypothetical protein